MVSGPNSRNTSITNFCVNYSWNHSYVNSRTELKVTVYIRMVLRMIYTEIRAARVSWMKPVCATDGDLVPVAPHSLLA